MSETVSESSELVCRPAKDPAVRAGIVALMGIGFGVWCHFDPKPYPEDFGNINQVAAWGLGEFGPWVFTLLGVVFLAWVIKHLIHPLKADDAGIHLATKTWPWDTMKVDASELAKRERLYIEVDGQRSELRAWRYDNFAKLLTVIEQRVPAARIEK